MEAKKKKASGPSRNRREREEKAGMTLVTCTIPLVVEAQASAIARAEKISRSAAIVRAIMAYYAAHFGDRAPWLVGERAPDEAEERGLANTQKR